MSGIELSIPRRSALRRKDDLSSTALAALDGVVIIAIAWGLVRLNVGTLTTEYLSMMLLLLAGLAVSFDHLAIYRSNRRFSVRVFNLFKAWTLTFLLLISVGFAFNISESYSRTVVAQLYVLGIIFTALLHYVFYRFQKLRSQGSGATEHAIVIGQGDLAGYLSMKIRSNPWLGQRLIGTVSLGEPEQERAELGFNGEKLPLLGSISRLSEILVSNDIRVAYIVTPLENSRVLNELYFTLLDHQIAIHWVPDIFSLRLINHGVDEIAGIPVLTLSETPLTGTRLLWKSLEDIVISAILLVLVSPLLLLIGVAIKLDSSGPVIFRQKRAGWNGRNFHIWKFRSMHVHQQEGGNVQQAFRGDPRVTRVGAFLRRTSLDELPQLINVLRGEMSLVGPRPHAIQHDAEYSRRIAEYFARYHIKPGITGLAQVRGHRGETAELSQMIQRVESDIEYINNWSIWLDFTILVRTFNAFTGKSAY
ncbi:undecaprenyl-phosphate glucose phosphotransferase [Microbulbifer sp. ALW1]|uniref:undecaprenyl-phosphate glucose phosphotransferase n=1 Tax=Microbulbifer sp. (strain ALW1) TaxID=1516059 RepID=UPI00135984DC|nr:undecaprenyl-phosphate glucose phosphotransferase [Microbulbifer sp. ALW1]